MPLSRKNGCRVASFTMLQSTGDKEAIPLLDGAYMLVLKGAVKTRHMCRAVQPFRRAVASVRAKVTNPVIDYL